jgi:hypothetical protein
MVHVGLRHRIFLAPGLGCRIEHVDNAHRLKAALRQPLDNVELAIDLILTASSAIMQSG